MNTATRAPISERAAYARLNRALAREGQALRRCREDSRSFHNLGHYYVVDLSLNCVVASHCDLEQLARETGVLKDWETIEER